MATLTSKDAYDLYETGKHRRYGLLFSVNGGAFAIAKLLAGEAGQAPVVLGHLTLPQLAVGMTLFTIVMVADTFMFGEKIRTTELRGAFGWQGKLVLLVLGFLLCAGWLLAGFRV
jgi:purine-cytosine permease-like protein